MENMYGCLSVLVAENQDLRRTVTFDHASFLCVKSNNCPTMHMYTKSVHKRQPQKTQQKTPQVVHLPAGC